MRFVQRDTAATLVVDLDERPDATPTFVVYDPHGASAQASSNTTLDSVDTTLSGAASAGATTLSVASATGITAGHRYLVGGAESAGGERVTVKSISGTTATLVRPLRSAKSSGAAFQSARLSLAITAAAVTRLGRHWRAEVTYTVSSAARSPLVVPFDVCRYVPATYLTLDEVRDLDPILAKRLPEGLWFPALRDRAWDMILSRVAAKHAPGALVGTVDLTTPHAYLCRALLAETAGAEWEPYRAQMAQRFGEELDAALGAHAIDDDQDGRVESHEGWRRGISLERG